MLIMSFSKKILLEKSGTSNNGTLPQNPKNLKTFDLRLVSGRKRGNRIDPEFYFEQKVKSC